MNSSAPQIGFDRFIRLDWVGCVLKVRAATSKIDELNALLDSACLGKEALAKTRTKLNALGLDPRYDLVDFIDRGRSLVADPDQIGAVLPFAWGAAIATYPFFGKVSEIIGRLTLIQGDCSVSEIHRRMSEVYGDRQITKRATQAVIQTQSSWGTLRRLEKGKRVIRLAPTLIDDDQLTSWVIEAAVRYTCKSVSVPALQSMPVLFPFTLSRPLAYLASNSANLDIRSDGPGNQYVGLRNASFSMKD